MPSKNGGKKFKEKCKTKLCVLCKTKPRFQLRRQCFQCIREAIKRKKEEKERLRLERKVKTKKHQRSLWKKLHNKAWKLISEYVRRNGADPFTGYTKCYTCGEVKHWKELQCGHFWHGTLDFDLRNLKKQCPQCNTYKSGNLAPYASKLIQEYGQEWFVKLEQDAHQHPGYTCEELEKIIEKFTQLNKLL